MLTGGEPLLDIERTRKIIEYLGKSQPFAKIYVYTAKLQPLFRVLDILDIVDGLTVTLHYPLIEIEKAYFNKFQGWIYTHREKNKSIRLRIDRKISGEIAIIPILWSKIDLFDQFSEDKLLLACPKDELWFEYTGE